MKILLFFIAVLLIVGGLVGGYVYFFYQPATPKPGEEVSVQPFPSSNTEEGESENGNNSQPTIPLIVQDGGSLQVKDFLHDTRTMPDPANEGYYGLGGAPEEQNDKAFSIEYIAKTNFFIVSLNKEPLAQSRRQAEQFLMQYLGLSQLQMCGIRYSLAAPHWVNEFYGGTDLRFSFCPGSVQLPE